jgi:hypothetical protein
MTYALALYQSLERSDPAAAMTKFRSSATVERDVKAFKEQLASVKTTEELFKNRRLMGFVLTAYGLETELNYMGRIKGVLMSDLSKPTSVANILKDRRYREIAGDLQMFKTGLDLLKNPATTDKVVDRYVAAQYELSISKENPALREARYFAKNIGKVSNVYEILGDNVLRKVVTSALGLPDQIAIQPVETQAELIKRRLDITQFKTASANAASDLRANAQTDVTGLDSARTALLKGVAQTNELVSRIRSTITGYDGLAALQDPAGVNAATVVVHTAAVPELVKMEGAGVAAEASIGRIADDINRLSTLRRLASDPANDAEFAAYKTEFAVVSERIRTEVESGADYRFEGADYNLLDGSLSGDLTTAITTTGTTVTLRRQDMTAFLAEVSNAATAFASAQNASDTDALSTANAAISRSGPMLGTVRDAVLSDRTANQTRIDAVANFTAAIDTAAVQRGRISLADADTRMKDIAAKLTELRSVATESANRDNGASRVDLNDRAATLIAAINTLANTPTSGADNLLGDADTTYALTTGRTITARGIGLVAKLDAELGSGNVNNKNTAAALRDAISATLMPAVIDGRETVAVDRKVFTLAATVLDARGKIDERVRNLANELPGIISRAASGTTNLLNATQKSITVQLKSAIGSLTVAPEITLRADLTAKLNAAAGQLPGNLSGAGGAYALLGEAATIAESANARLTTLRGVADSMLFGARQRLTQAPATPATTTTAPTEYTKRFVQRYLALSDMKAVSGGGATPTGPGAAMLGLFA